MIFRKADEAQAQKRCLEPYISCKKRSRLPDIFFVQAILILALGKSDRRRGQDIPELTAWDGFYAIVGSAALIGFTVRRCNAHCRETPSRCGGGRSHLCDSDDRSFRGRVVLVSSSTRTLASDHPRRSSWGLMGLGGGAYVVVLRDHEAENLVVRPVTPSPRHIPIEFARLPSSWPCVANTF